MRWVIAGALFIATALNYADRQVLGIMAGTLQQHLHWTEVQYGNIVMAFTAAYSIGLLVFSPVIDKVGTRIGYALSVAWWSVAGTFHAAVSTTMGFGVARFFLGLGEAGNFPAAIATVTESFPREERALAVGIFNGGSNVGAILVPLVVPFMVLHFGWRSAFLLTPVVGLTWAALWYIFYRRPAASSDLDEAEQANALNGNASPVAAKLSWKSALLYRQTWALCIARFLTDPVWWFYLYWTPKYLSAKHGISLGAVGLPLIIIYLSADAGSLTGGWLSSGLIKRNVSINAARKIAILVSALLVLPMAFEANTSVMWKAVLVISLAAAGHQGWAANMFASISDMYPQRMVGSITGLAGFAGSLGGIVAASAIGLLLQKFGSYTPIFIYAGVSYLLVLCILQIMIPRIEPIHAS
jgi:MFS transporter, ACS family, hexuronate transporter